MSGSFPIRMICDGSRAFYKQIAEIGLTIESPQTIHDPGHVLGRDDSSEGRPSEFLLTFTFTLDVAAPVSA
jgi:hypothetical protein